MKSLAVLFIYTLLVACSKKVIKRKENGVEINYLSRYYLIPNNKYFNIFLHYFTYSDIDNFLHNHPFHSLSVLLKGSYYEAKPRYYDKWVKENNRLIDFEFKPQFSVIFRKPETTHKIKLCKDQNNNDIPVWTLFITGPTVQSWGFWCAQGLVDNNDFLTPDGLSVGKGCDQ